MKRGTEEQAFFSTSVGDLINESHNPQTLS